MKKQKVRVSVKAAIQRVNRKLDEEKVHRSRSARARLDLGDFYTINTRYNVIGQKDVDLEALAREVGALKDYEEIAEG